MYIIYTYLYIQTIVWVLLFNFVLLYIFIMLNITENKKKQQQEETKFLLKNYQVQVYKTHLHIYNMRWLSEYNL